MEFLKIDGSFGEGGGQILRTAITLSCILKQPIIIENIRKNRKNPGLKPQHLAILKILKKTCNAEFNQIKIGDTVLKLIPGEIKNTKLNEKVGTAASISLIFHVLIPVFAICKKKLKLTISGGTDVLWSPTIDYTQNILREGYSRMGIDFSINIIKRGYYPRGGGIVELDVLPSERINSLVLNSPKIKNIKLTCTFSKLPFKLIQNQINKIKNQLIKKDFSIDDIVKEEQAIDSGSSMMIYCIGKNSIFGSDSLFNKKTEEFDLDLNQFIENRGSIDKNLADMLVLPASLANGMTIFQVENISKHLETNLFVASKITGCKYGIGKLEKAYEVRIEGISYSHIK